MTTLETSAAFVVGALAGAVVLVPGAVVVGLVGARLGAVVGAGLLLGAAEGAGELLLGAAEGAGELLLGAAEGAGVVELVGGSVVPPAGIKGPFRMYRSKAAPSALVVPEYHPVVMTVI